MALYETSSCHLGTIIKLYPEEEPWCAGFAPSKGRRCQCRTNAANRRTACSLLNKGSRELEQDKPIDDLLDRLAPLVLCTRWHQNQWADLADRWTEKVKIFQTRRTSARRTPGSRSSPLSSRSSVDQFENNTTTRNDARRGPQPEGFTTRTDEILENISAQLEQLLERLNDSSATSSRLTEGTIASISNRSIQPAASTIATPVARTSIDSTTSPRTPSTASTRTSRSVTMPASVTRSTSNNTQRTPTQTMNPFRAREALPSSHAGRIPSPAANPGAYATTTPTPASPPLSTRASARSINRTTQTRRIVTRRPVEGDCSICINPLDDHQDDDNNDDTSGTGEPRGQLSWCKTQCGNNYHKECIDQWLETCRRMSQRPTCPFCRGQWAE